jgi:hypothetical protein
MNDEDAVKYARGSGCGVGDILADLERRGFCGE